MKSQDELNEIKGRAKAVLEELGELNEEELDLIAGGTEFDSAVAKVKEAMENGWWHQRSESLRKLCK